MAGKRSWKTWCGALLGAAFLSVGAAALAEEYQSPQAFLDESFAGRPPPAQVLWLTGARREAATQILGHSPRALRLHYWARGTRSAWILEEIGKERPITAGFVVDHGHIARMKVLAFRESRGYEIRYPFFTDQFRGAGLTDDRQLDTRIDGISGATLSVRAMKRLARLALYLSRHTEAQDAKG